MIELLKALAKFLLILFVALTVLKPDIDDLLRIAHEPLEQAIIHSVQLVGWSTLWMACGLILIAAVDVPVQLYQSHKKLMMTKQEIRGAQGSGRSSRGQAAHPPVAARHVPAANDGGIPTPTWSSPTRLTTPWPSSTTRTRAARRC